MNRLLHPLAAVGLALGLTAGLAAQVSPVVFQVSAAYDGSACHRPASGTWSIVIHEGKIVAMGPTESVAVPPGATVHAGGADSVVAPGFVLARSLEGAPRDLRSVTPERDTIPSRMRRPTGERASSPPTWPPEIAGCCRGRERWCGSDRTPRICARSSISTGRSSRPPTLPAPSTKPR